MKGKFGDGGSEDEEAYQSYYGIEKRALTRRRFVKTSAAVGAAVVGIPYNLTDIADIVLKEDGEVIIYPVVYEYEVLSGESYKKHRIGIKLWGAIGIANGAQRNVVAVLRVYPHWEYLLIS